jgi:hypothetical protein
MAFPTGLTGTVCSPGFWIDPRIAEATRSGTWTEFGAGDRSRKGDDFKVRVWYR